MQDFLVAASGDLLEFARQIHRPATVVTNLLIAVQCGVQARRVTAREPGPGGEARAWRAFFACVGASALLGAAKHGTPGLIDPALHTAISLGSNMALGGAVAALHGILAPGRPVARVAWGLFYLLAATASAVRGSFALTGLAAALGMLPVVVAGVRDAARGRPGGRELAAAWATAVLAGIAWVRGPIPADWFGRVDVAHVVLIVALGLVLLGAERRIGRAPRRAHPT